MFSFVLTNLLTFLIHTGAEAITILTFPTRKLGEQGHTFEILRAQCNMKEWEVKRCLANKMREISTLPSTGTDKNFFSFKFLFYFIC